MTAILRRFAWAGACLLGWSQAHAICTIGITPKFWVGDVASDPQCTADSIQAAIDATVCPNTQIYITGEHTYTAQALNIPGKSLSLIGSSGLCGEPPAASTVPVRTISGTTGASVITISGNSKVTLQALEITGGSIGSGAEGGGIFFNGNGSLTLSATTVDNNQADYGAGIDVSPTDTTTLTLQANTLVINNQAAISGGGIRIEGNTHLIAVADQTLIGFNTATSGYGGGVEVIGPAYADIGSPGYGSEGVISNNTGAYGGGIAGVANNDNFDDAFVQLFTTVAERPVNVQNNIATIAGGGIYLKPNVGVGGYSLANACLSNFRIDDNTAAEGAAIYLDWDSSLGSDFGAIALLNTTGITGSSGFYSCAPQPPSDFGAVACAPDAQCNEISGNTGHDGQGNPNGGVIFVGQEADIEGAHFSLRGNQAANALHILGGTFLGGYTFSAIQSCLFADNEFSGQLIFGDGSRTEFEMDNCTLAHDVIGASDVIQIDTNTTLTLRDDIFDELGKYTLAQPGDADLTVSYILSNDISTLPTSPTIISQNLGDPLFVDATHGNYHLVAYTQNDLLTATRAIDFAPTVSGDPAHDLDGNPYAVDVPAVPDAYGTRDLGAYEAQPITDRVFADGFGDRVSLVH